MDERPDDLLVGEARRGDRGAFAELVRRHERRVYGLVFRMVRDHSDADDLAQEVFLMAFRSIGSFRRGAAFSTWLHRIAVNGCTNRVNSKTYRQKRRTVALDNPGPGRDSARRVANGSPDPADRLEEAWVDRLKQVAAQISAQTSSWLSRPPTTKPPPWR